MGSVEVVSHDKLMAVLVHASHACCCLTHDVVGPGHLKVQSLPLEHDRRTSYAGRPP